MPSSRPPAPAAPRPRCRSCDLALLQPVFVLVLLVAVFATMVTERMRVDVVSMGAACILVATGILSTQDVLAVFSNEAPITVAAMFVLSAALERTGVVERAGNLLSRRASGSPWRHAGHHDRRRRRLRLHEQHARRGHPDPGRDSARALDAA